MDVITYPCHYLKMYVNKETSICPLSWERGMAVIRLQMKTVSQASNLGMDK